MAVINNFKVVDFIGNNILARTVNSLAFAHTANRDWVEPWSANQSFKIGDVLRIRKPVMYTGGNGAALNIEAIDERQTTLSIDYDATVGIAFTSAELQRFIDNPQSNIYEGAAQTICNKIDSTIANALQTRVWRTVGTAGAGVTTFATPEDSITRQRMFGVVNSKYMAMNPQDAGSLRTGLYNSFNTPFNQEICQDAMIGNFGRHDLFEDQNIPTHTTGTFAGTALVDGASQTGSSINLKGFTALQTGVLKAGDIITFAGVYGVNPINRQVVGLGTGNLAQFVVQADVDSNGSGLAVVSVLPALELTGPYQNVSALPADSAAVSCKGVTSPGTAAYFTSNYTYSSDAITLAVVPGPVSPGCVYSKVFTDADTGISIRCNISYNINTDQSIMRFDSFFGVQAFGEYATRFIG